MYRLSYERRGGISFIARETISYFVTSERGKRETKYYIRTRAIKLILPSLKCDKPVYHILVPLSGAKIRLYFQMIYTLSTFRN